MGKTKVVIDTNILISALGWEGNPRKILDKIEKGEIEALTSPKQWEELSRVLDYPHLRFSSEQKEKIKATLTEFFTFVHPKEEITIITSDPQDNRILECAQEGGGDYIISGDEHILSLKEFNGIKIKTPAQFLKDFSS